MRIQKASEIGDTLEASDTPVEAWLPHWGRKLLLEETDGLGATLGVMLSIVFRDLWALWDALRLPDDAVCRLVVLQDLRNLRETALSGGAGAEAPMSRMVEHLKLASTDLSEVERRDWEANRQRFWRPVRRLDVIEAHVRALETWTSIQDPVTERDLRR